VTPEQELRALAIQAAASHCAARDVSLEDVVFVADVFCGYIQDGAERALQIDAAGTRQVQLEPGMGDTSPAEGPAPVVRDVELREERSVEDVPVSFDPDPVTVMRAVQDTESAPVEPSASGPEPNPPSADIIPLAARGSTTPQQSSARHKIEKLRREAANKILAEAKSAKALEHKRRLYEKAEEKGLCNLLLEIDGQTRELGPYLESLAGA
jgi:hypothetical protein